MRSLLVVALGVAAAVLSLPCQAEARSPTAPVLTRDSVCSAPTPSRLTVRSGVNEVLAIARGHLNRLITPFDKPRATTVNEAASVQVKGRVIYVASNTDAPMSLFITPDNSEAVAISLTLVPCSLPPRELTLLLEGGADLLRTAGEGKDAATTGEEPQPYIETLTQALRALALQQTPPGYNLRAFQRGDPTPLCALPGLDVRPAQVLEGQHLVITVALARNVTAGRITLTETTCAGPTVAAVAAWPQVVLEAGQATELYLVTRRPDPAATAAPRPSLLGGR